MDWGYFKGAYVHYGSRVQLRHHFQFQGMSPHATSARRGPWSDLVAATRNDAMAMAIEIEDAAVTITMEVVIVQARFGEDERGLVSENIPYPLR